MTIPEPPPDGPTDFLAPRPAGERDYAWRSRIRRAAGRHLRDRTATAADRPWCNMAVTQVATIGMFVISLRQPVVSASTRDWCGEVSEQDLAATMLRLHAARADIDETEASLVQEARDRGWSWKLIARLVGRGAGSGQMRVWVEQGKRAADKRAAEDTELRALVDSAGLVVAVTPAGSMNPGAPQHVGYRAAEGGTRLGCTGEEGKAQSSGGTWCPSCVDFLHGQTGEDK